MRSVLGYLAVGLAGIALYAQSPAAASVSQPVAGMTPDWDIRVVLGEISAHASRMIPVLERIDTKAWTARGASETYAAQLQSSKDQARALAAGAKELSAHPEKLSAGLELFFRMNALESMLISLQEGIRKYQNPAVAEMLAGVAAENSANRDRFQRYIVDLAAERDQQFIVMDREAQRCRGMLARQPVEIPKNSGRKK